MVMSRRGGRRPTIMQEPSQPGCVTMQFELKVELRTFNSQKKYFKRHIQHCINVRGPAILPHVLFECREN